MLYSLVSGGERNGPGRFVGSEWDGDEEAMYQDIRDTVQRGLSHTDPNNDYITVYRGFFCQGGWFACRVLPWGGDHYNVTVLVDNRIGPDDASIGLKTAWRGQGGVKRV